MLFIYYFSSDIPPVVESQLKTLRQKFRARTAKFKKQALEPSLSDDSDEEEMTKQPGINCNCCYYTNFHSKTSGCLLISISSQSFNTFYNVCMQMLLHQSHADVTYSVLFCMGSRLFPAIPLITQKLSHLMRSLLFQRYFQLLLYMYILLLWWLYTDYNIFYPLIWYDCC